MEKAQKKKKKEVNHADAMNSFIKKLAGTEAPPSQLSASGAQIIQEKPREERKEKEAFREAREEKGNKIKTAINNETKNASIDDDKVKESPKKGEQGAQQK